MKLFILLLVILSNVCTAKVVETREKIAILDSGIRPSGLEKYLCKDGHFDLTGEGLVDVLDHGTNIAWIISKYIDPKKSCLLIIKVFRHYEANSVFDIANGLNRVNTIDNVKFINISGGGESPCENEKDELQIAVDRGTTVCVAAGNKSMDLSKSCAYYPACYDIKKNYFVVASGDENGLHKFSNYGGPVNRIENGKSVDGGNIIMTGTSQATAICTGKNAGGWYNKD